MPFGESGAKIDLHQQNRNRLSAGPSTFQTTWRGMNPSWLPSSDPPPVHLIPLPPSKGMTCRCGNRSSAELRFLKVDGLPESVEGLFEGLGFCSVRCVRAQFLETLSILDELDTPMAEELVSDLRSTYLKFVAAFAAMLEHLDGEGVPWN